MSAKSSNNSGSRRNRAAQPAEQSVEMDPRQREQAMKFLATIMGQGHQYVPILKQLEAIGLKPVTMPVMIGDEPTDCLVIPVSELMSKEWNHMSGLKEIEENA